MVEVEKIEFANGVWRALVTFVDGDLSAPVSIPVILSDSTDLEFVVPAVS